MKNFAKIYQIINGCTLKIWSHNYFLSITNLIRLSSFCIALNTSYILVIDSHKFKLAAILLNDLRLKVPKLNYKLNFVCKTVFLPSHYFI